jgi:hypothetical protein
MWPTAATANPAIKFGRDHSVMGGVIISESGGGVIPLRGRLPPEPARSAVASVAFPPDNAPSA